MNIPKSKFTDRSYREKKYELSEKRCENMILTYDVASDGDGDESLVRMKRRGVRLQRLLATPDMAQIQMLHRRPLHGSSWFAQCIVRRDLA